VGTPVSVEEDHHETLPARAAVAGDGRRLRSLVHFRVTFINQSIVNCAATATYLRRSGDSALNGSNHFTIIQFDPTELLIYIWNSTQSQTMDIPFALIVAC
jgi:hypothetical protein